MTSENIERTLRSKTLIRIRSFLLSASTLLVSSAPAGAIVYNVDIPSFVVGTITTDGNTTTPLTASDITNWQLNQTADTVHYISGLNPSNSTLSLTAGALSATATELLFNFSDTSPSKLEFASTVVPGNSLQYCDAASACINQVGASDFSQAMYVFVAPGCCSTSGGQVESGIVAIAAASVTPTVPEPSTWAMMLVGFAGLGFLGWRGRRREARPA